MNICLIFAGIGLADYLLDKIFGVEFDPNSQPYYGIGIVVITFNFFVPCFLVVARFMRDEYAELLWRRTAVVLAYMLALTPLFALAAVWIDYWTSTTGQPRAFAANFEQTDNLFDAMMRVWSAFMLLFTGIFQWLRWLDSRA